MNDLEIEHTHLFTAEQKKEWWGAGEWVEESDLARFTYKEVSCIVRRCAVREPFAKEEHISGGYLCGYIELPLDSTYINCVYDDIPIDCHGGLTFKEENLIGYDCAHSGDYNPSIELFKKQNPSSLDIPKELKKYSIFNPTYRNMEYCIQECKSMVDQLLQLTSHSLD
jgi:hypothetical protein